MFPLFAAVSEVLRLWIALTTRDFPAGVCNLVHCSSGGASASRYIRCNPCIRVFYALSTERLSQSPHGPQIKETFGDVFSSVSYDRIYHRHKDWRSG